MLRSGIAAAILLHVAACDGGPPDSKVAEAPGNAAIEPAGENELAATPAAGSSALVTTLAPLSGGEATAKMKQREEKFEKLGDAAKASFKALESSSPDMAVIARSAATIAELAPQLPSWFPPGTGPEAGKTEARAEIWQQREEFASRHAALVKAATAYDVAAKGGDVAAVKAAYADLGKSCKACHDKFRDEKKK